MEEDSETSLEPGQSDELKLIGAMIAHGEPTAEIESKWKGFVERSKGKLSQSDIPGLVQLVLTEAYQKNTNDLQFHAEKIQYLNALKKQIEDELERTRKIMDEYIERLEQSLQTAGDDAQLANVDLQNTLQRQQQTLQTMSNVSKMLHDTAMGIIRKIG